eukprot:6187311-Pleurochrysis_carterae.AAC.2
MSSDVLARSSRSTHTSAVPVWSSANSILPAYPRDDALLARGLVKDRDRRDSSDRGTRTVTWVLRVES